MVHDPEPVVANLPAGQMEARGLVLPAAHAYPAAQFPLHVATFMATVDPYLPAGHGRHAGNPLRLYVPAEQAPAQRAVVAPLLVPL